MPMATAYSAKKKYHIFSSQPINCRSFAGKWLPVIWKVMRFSLKSRIASLKIQPKANKSMRYFCIKLQRPRAMGHRSSSGVGTINFSNEPINYCLYFRRQLWTWKKAKFMREHRRKALNQIQRCRLPIPIWLTLHWAKSIHKLPSWRENWRSPATLCSHRSSYRCWKLRPNSKRPTETVTRIEMPSHSLLNTNVIIC